MALHSTNLQVHFNALLFAWSGIRTVTLECGNHVREKIVPAPLYSLVKTRSGTWKAKRQSQGQHSLRLCSRYLTLCSAYHYIVHSIRTTTQKIG